MRASTARLTNSPVRLADLRFPQVDQLIHRTRLAFVHLDNLLAFAKRDRDGRVDGYISAHLPDVCLLLFFRGGEAVNAALMHSAGREVITITEALRRMRGETERGDLTYCTAPLEQLAWMYEACAAPVQPRFVDAGQPKALFPVLATEQVTGVLEFISNGRVSYVHLDQGRYVDGYYCEKPDDLPVPRYFESLFNCGDDGSNPALSACLFPYVAELPAQAPHALINTYRELYWRIVDAVEQELPGEGKKRAQRVSGAHEQRHRALTVISVPRGTEIPEAVVQPDELATALGEWANELLDSVEIMMPGTAVKVLREATREHRYVLQSAGFYKSLPWQVAW
jgi:hypothetical protein